MFKFCFFGYENCLFDISGIKVPEWYFQSDYNRLLYDYTHERDIHVGLKAIPEMVSVVKALKEQGSECVCVSTQNTSLREHVYRSKLLGCYGEGIKLHVVQNTFLKVSLYDMIIKYTETNPHEVLVIDNDPFVVSYFSDNGCFGYSVESVIRGRLLSVQK